MSQQVTTAGCQPVRRGSFPLRDAQHMEEAVVTFLRESNAIENVWDEASLEIAIRAWEYIIAQDKLTPENVKETHNILMQGKLPKHECGEYRTAAVYVNSLEKSKWYALPALTYNWCKRANETIHLKIPKEKLADFIKEDHVAYEEIHPFFDGNGRTGRIFMNWQRVKVGLPVLILYEKEKRRYYQWFRRIKI